MAHRRTQSSRSFAMPPPSPLSQAVSASGVGLAAVVSAAAAALAPVASSLPGAMPRSASSLDVADFLVPPTPGTPSKFDRRNPMHVAAPPFLASALASPRALLRRFTAVLSPQRAHAESLPLKSPFLRSTPVPTLPIPLRRRATFLALVVLLALSAWTVLTTSLAEHDSRGWTDWHKRAPQGTDSAGRHRFLNSASFRGATTLPGSHNTPSYPNANANGPERPSLTLTPRDELAALTAFMAALPWNALPAHVDARAPLDPELILDFDVRRNRDRALTQLAELRRDTWALNPVVIFGKSRHAPTRELRALLDSMHLTPAPTVFEIDTRVDEHIITPLLARLTSATDSSSESSESSFVTEFALPILLVGGEPVDVSDSPLPEERGGPLRERDTVKALLEGGDLRRRVTAAGAVPSEKKRKGKGRR
ncbi:hypothetical protein M0805_002855 [Coniferiporia weirii]|nr:hypothetical protein M0805_002855 [Coniferiporia weirii]